MTYRKNLIEQYAKELRIHNELRPLANSRERQEESIRTILTRFVAQLIADYDPIEVDSIRDHLSDLISQDKRLSPARSTDEFTVHDLVMEHFAAALRTVGGPSHDVAASLWHWIAMYGPNIHIAHGNRLIHLKNGLSNPTNPDDYCDDQDCQICNDIKMANPRPI